jgi:hypothetical protein
LASTRVLHLVKDPRGTFFIADIRVGTAEQSMAIHTIGRSIYCRSKKSEYRVSECAGL